MNNPVICTDNVIPNLLHGCASNVDVVFKWIILLSDVHHKSRNEYTTPDMTIDFAWKVFILELFTASGLRQFGFLLNYECLVHV